MRTIANDGWSKMEIQQFVYENTHNSVAHLKRTERLAGTLTAADETTMRPLVPTLRMCWWSRRGAAGAFSCYIPGWAGARSRRRASRSSFQTGGRDGMEILDPTVEPRKQP